MGFFDRNWKAAGGLHSQLLSPGTANGSAVDLFGYEEAAILVDVGSMDTGATLNLKVQESANGTSGWTDVTGAAFTQFTKAAHENTVHLASLKASARKRYARLVATTAVGNVRVGGAFLLGVPWEGPVTQDFATGFRV